jgi:hypothetical protein
MVVREINKQEPLLQFFEPSQYISKLDVIRRASYIKCFDKEAYMWIGEFFPLGRTKKTNARVLKYVMSFLSNSIRQWDLKPPGEKPVKDETISYNEG